MRRRSPFYLDNRALAQKTCPCETDRSHECRCATVALYASMKRTHSSGPQDGKCKEHIRLLFLRTQGHRDQVLLCKTRRMFARGKEHARVELLARDISTRPNNWGATFGMFRCFFGIKTCCISRVFYTNLRLPGNDRTSHDKGEPQGLCRLEIATTHCHPDIRTQ